MAEIERRRRRLRPHAGNPPPAPAPPPVTETPRGRSGNGGGNGPGEDSERGLRGLVGSGSSQVSVTAALRARDAARPGDEHLAEAERMTIVRRNWAPREELPRNNR